MPFVRINEETHYLWRAVDHEGEVLEVFATKRRGRKAALKFFKKMMKRYGRPRSIVTDRLRSYRSAMKVISNAADQECGRWLNNRAENSHQPFQRRERAMAKFRDMKTLQKFATAHASIHNHFQPRPPPQPSRYFQAKPRCRLSRVASAGGLNASDQHHSQARSGLSDNAI
jgi:putative transposase